ncbi:MAG: inositol monophosphatase [Myxococcales bacterium]|nr:inositol monophosphatase [Myxococcales bacterium]
MRELIVARRVAAEAGAILRAGAGRAHSSDAKRTSVDLVTEYDRRSEAHVVAQLRAAFPDDEVVAEEGGGQAGASGRHWLVDPLDGTTNFAHGLPFFCVSIGLEDGSGPLAGVVEAPALGWHFYAARGQGAFLVEEGRTLEPRRLAVSDTPALEQSLLATGFPYDTATSARNNLREWTALYPRTQGLRRVGAAALDLCFVAAGWMDGYWELKIKPWDVAAGALLVTEAGGRVTGYRGQPYASDAGEILATNGRLHDALAAALAETAA